MTTVVAVFSAQVVASGYLTKAEVEERLLARTYYIAMTGPEIGHYDVAGTVALKSFRFLENGKIDYRILGMAAKENWRGELDWKVKPDGRFCMPNLKGRMRCLFVREEDDYLRMFNRKDMRIFSLSPHVTGF